MAASTGPRAKYAKLDRPFKVAYPVAASTKLNKDTLVGLLSGVLVPMAATASIKFAGIVESGHDNSNGVLGAISDASVLKEGSHAFVYGPGIPGTLATAYANINGVAMYAADDQTVQPTQGTNMVYVGEGVYDPDPDLVNKGLIRVRIDKAVS